MDDAERDRHELMGGRREPGGGRVALRELMDLTRAEPTMWAVLSFPYWTGEGPVVDGGEGATAAVSWQAVERKVRALFWRTERCTRCGTEVGMVDVADAEVGMNSGLIAPPGLWEAPVLSTLGESGALLTDEEASTAALVVRWHRPSVCDARRTRNVAAPGGGD